MKKTFILILTVVAMLLVSCTPSIDTLIDRYEKAAKDCDTKKMYDIAMQIDEQLKEDNKELTPEQAQRFVKIASEIEIK